MTINTNNTILSDRDNRDAANRARMVEARDILEATNMLPLYESLFQALEPSAALCWVGEDLQNAADEVCAAADRMRQYLPSEPEPEPEPQTNQARSEESIMEGVKDMLEAICPEFDLDSDSIEWGCETYLSLRARADLQSLSREQIVWLERDVLHLSEMVLG